MDANEPLVVCEPGFHSGKRARVAALADRLDSRCTDIRIGIGR